MLSCCYCFVLVSNWLRCWVQFLIWLMWTVVQMSVYFSKSSQCYSALSCMCASWGPVWGLSAVYLMHQFSKLIGIMFRVISTAQLRGEPKGSYKMFWNPFLDHLFLYSVSPNNLAPQVPSSWSSASLFNLHACPELASASRCKWQEDREKKMEIFLYALWITSFLWLESRIILFSGTHLTATATTTTGLQLQEWGLLAAKLRKKEENVRNLPLLSLSSRGCTSQS